MKRMELLAPAGDLERLEIAVEYGADAVYFGSGSFSLRSGPDNFSTKDMKAGLDIAKRRGVKCFLALNIYARDEDYGPMSEYLKEISGLAFDAYIVSDPGVMKLVSSNIPGARLHLSTQANTVSAASANYWHGQGVERIVLARELSLSEISRIRRNTPDNLELEAFVHGAMCMAYSGRCLLSNFLTGRDANRGNCAHPCRWKYSLTEEKRPGEYFAVEEDRNGAYIMNANDLCMIRHIPELAEAGLDSLKIEGRKKSAFYVAVVTGAYRKALDAYYADPGNYRFDEKLAEDLAMASHRPTSTGFYFHPPTGESHGYEDSGYIRNAVFTGLVRSYDEVSGYAVVEQRNKMVLGDMIYIFGSKTQGFTQILTEMADESGTPLPSAPHPQQMLRIKTDRPVRPLDILCIRKEQPWTTA